MGQGMELSQPHVGLVQLTVSILPRPRGDRRPRVNILADRGQKTLGQVELLRRWLAAVRQAKQPANSSGVVGRVRVGSRRLERRVKASRRQCSGMMHHERMVECEECLLRYGRFAPYRDVQVGLAKSKIRSVGGRN